MSSQLNYLIPVGVFMIHYYLCRLLLFLVSVTFSKLLTHVHIRTAYFYSSNSIQVKSNQYESNQIKSNQIKSNPCNMNQYESIFHVAMELYFLKQGMRYHIITYHNIS